MAKRTVRIGYEGGPVRDAEIQVPDGEPELGDAATRLRVAGGRVPRLDGAAKVTGRAR